MPGSFFPDPASADGTGLVAITHEITTDLLLEAYTRGIFPWSENPVRWYSPEPRAIFVRRFFWLAGGVTVSGLEHMPAEGPLILASNHASFLDPILLGSSLPRHVNAIARSSLFRNPLINRLFRGLLAMPVDREGDGADQRGAGIET